MIECAMGGGGICMEYTVANDIVSIVAFFEYNILKLYEFNSKK
jgi:hypothetical protein